MKAKDRFKKWFNQISDSGKRNLVFHPYGNLPCSLNVCYQEIMNDTKQGKIMLNELGFIDKKEAK